MPLPGRIGWISDTIDILERARARGNNQEFFSRFAAARVYAELPGFFGKQDQALTDLEWLAANREKAPVQVQMREVYRQLARLYGEDGRTKDAALYLGASGLVDPDTPLTLFTNQAVGPVNGSTFHPRCFEEVVPDRVYPLSGIEFTRTQFLPAAEPRRSLLWPSELRRGASKHGQRAGGSGCLVLRRRLQP